MDEKKKKRVMKSPLAEKKRDLCSGKCCAAPISSPLSKLSEITVPFQANQWARELPDTADDKRKSLNPKDEEIPKREEESERWTRQQD